MRTFVAGIVWGTWIGIGLAGIAEAQQTPAGYMMELRERFEHVPLGEVPSGWNEAETNGAGSRGAWQVVEAEPGREYDSDRRMVRLTKSTNEGSTYNLLMTKASVPSNFTMEVALRAESGGEDQGGGLFWHARDKKNYMITRWNPLERNLRIYRVENGVRTQIYGSGVNVDPKAWHVLRVEVKGSIVRVSLDNVLAIVCSAKPVSTGGRVGLWTKADAVTSFDRFEVKGQFGS